MIKRKPIKEKKAPRETDLLVGRRLRMLRMSKGMSQELLGNRVGLTFQQIQKYEKGANRISASRLVEFANILNVPVHALFGDGTPRPADAEILDLCDSIGAAKLLRLYNEIPNPTLRASVIKFAAALARKADE